MLRVSDHPVPPGSGFHEEINNIPVALEMLDPALRDKMGVAIQRVDEPIQDFNLTLRKIIEPAGAALFDQLIVSLRKPVKIWRPTVEHYFVALRYCHLCGKGPCNGSEDCD